MSLWAVVPFKELRDAKSRLEGALSPDERISVSRDLLARTIEILVAAPTVDRTLLVSRDEEALDLGRSLGAETLAETGVPDLNRAVRQAAEHAAHSGATAVLALPADLPLLTPTEVDRLCQAAAQPPVVVLAPDRRLDGTNALLLSPPGLIEYAFGAASYRRHLETARQAGVRVVVCDLPGLAFDLDRVEDLELLRTGGAALRPLHPRGAA